MKNFVDSLQRDVFDFKTLSPQVKFLLLIQVVILFILSILVGVLFSPQFNSQVKQNPNSTVNPTQNSSTQLSITPQDEIIKIGEERIMTVHIAGAPVTAIDVVLTYDPKIVEIRDITNGGSFDKVIVNKVENGKVYYSAAKSIDAAGGGGGASGAKTAPDGTGADEINGTKAPSGGAVFGFSVKALKKVETTKIGFLLEETITAEGGKNTLGVAQPAVIHVFD